MKNTIKVIRNFNRTKLLQFIFLMSFCLFNLHCIKGQKTVKDGSSSPENSQSQELQKISTCECGGTTISCACGGCGCVSSGGEVWISCCGSIYKNPKLQNGKKISVRLDNISMIEFAKFFESILENKSVFIPISKLNEKCTINIDDVKIEELCKKIDLVIIDKIIVKN
ncbi:MAG: hypothetical protein V4683_15565 [Bacteroidota bacterium]